MTSLADIFTPSASYSVISLGIAFVSGVIIGLLFKRGLIAKEKKRVLHLEEEMLSNHARILSLEGEIAEMRREASKAAAAKPDTQPIGLKAS